jgi:hypothetical protein
MAAKRSGEHGGRAWWKQKKTVEWMELLEFSKWVLSQWVEVAQNAVCTQRLMFCYRRGVMTGRKETERTQRNGLSSLIESQWSARASGQHRVARGKWEAIRITFSWPCLKMQWSLSPVVSWTGMRKGQDRRPLAQGVGPSDLCLLSPRAVSGCPWKECKMVCCIRAWGQQVRQFPWQHENSPSCQWSPCHLCEENFLPWLY